MLAGFVVGIANAVVGPALAFVAVPLSVLTLGVGAIILDALFVLLPLDLPGVGIEGVLDRARGGHRSGDRHDNGQRGARHRRQLVARRAGGPPSPTRLKDVTDVTEVPGAVFIQLDGVARAVLRRALRSADVPSLHRCIRDGSHVLVGWDTGWSSQTDVGQCGILHGSTVDMPAVPLDRQADRRGDGVGAYALLRTFATVVTRDVSVQAVVNDVCERRAAIYVVVSATTRSLTTSGPERVDALAVLRDLDRHVGRIERTATWTPRPYKIVACPTTARRTAPPSSNAPVRRGVEEGHRLDRRSALGVRPCASRCRGQ